MYTRHLTFALILKVFVHTVELEPQNIHSLGTYFVKGIIISLAVFQISGIALIVIGGIIKGKYGDFIQLSDSSITTGPIFLIIIGVIVAIVGFLGCCGAYKENYCMVTTVRIVFCFYIVDLRDNII